VSARKGKELSHEETPSATILNKQKCHFFGFSFAKSENSSREQVLLGVWGGWYQWEGEEEGKRGKVVNTVQILCAHIRKWENDTC
jgi:hypothetical protein